MERANKRNKKSLTLVQSITTNRQRIPSPLEKGFEKNKLRFVSLAAIF